MLPLLASLLVAPASAGDAPAALPKATVGQPAPDFALKDLTGKEVKLSSFAGKTVVIEWFNPGCPFVVYAHGEGPLKDQAKTATGGGVVWLAVNSGAPGKQGNGLELNQQATASWGMTHPVLLDETGAVGKSYGATTTPNMYVVDPKGTLVYAGALDNAPLGKADGAPVNYVNAALADIAAGRAVSTPTTKPYGCGVKYGS
ncbi:MAG: redoxin domain-containing protein [Pseudomonadota bacterium]|nr:redoxin domain-containing protein [Pseudomonadota bacterium]